MRTTYAQSSQIEALLRVTLTAAVATKQPSVGALGSDRAILLSAGSRVLLMGNEAEVRPDKIAAVQAALLAGTYHVPVSAVASRIVNYMLVL